MANSLTPASWVARKSLSIMHAKAAAAVRVNRDYDQEFRPVGGVPRGTTITIRLPFKYLASAGNALNAQNSVQRTASLTVSQQHVDVNFSSVERGQSLGDFTTQVLEPAMSQLSGVLEGNVCALATQVPKQVGTSSTAVTFSTVLQSRQFLTEALAPAGDGRTLLVSPLHNYELVNSNAALFNPGKTISNQFVEGLIAESYAGYMAIEETKLPGYTTGTFGVSTPVVKTGTTAGITGSGNAYASTMTLSSTGWASSASTLNAGDVFTVQNVFEVDPETKVSLGRLKQFVVTAQISDTSGEIDMVAAPAAISGGAYQNVTALPNGATNSTITMASASASTFRQSLAFYRDAITFASVPMFDLSSVVKYYAQESFDGFNLRVASAWDINNDFIPVRIDVLTGQVLGMPEVAVKMIGV